MSEDNNSTGVTLPYEKQAMRGDPMPDGMEYPDQVMYQALSALYARYRLRMISSEQARREKRNLIRWHETNEYRWSLGSWWAQIIRQTELACSDYRKNRTLETADRLADALEGVMQHGKK